MKGKLLVWLVAAILPAIAFAGMRDHSAVNAQPADSASPSTTVILVPSDRPLRGDSRQSTAQWNEFFHSRAGLFAPMEAYTITIDYTVVARGSNAGFYMLLRSASGSGPDDGWQEWRGESGQSGQAELSVVIRKPNDYYLIVGIEHKGALMVNSLTVSADPANQPLDIGLPAVNVTWRSPGNTSYYVDSSNGSDTNTGTSPDHPWRSLDRIDSGAFAAGDKILLHTGGKWAGSLVVCAEGSADAPVVVDSYGKGAKPRIDAQGLFLATLYLANSEYVTARNLDIANKGRVAQPGLTGVTVSERDFGTAHDVVLDSLDVHDVTGSDVKAEGGGAGISCDCSGARTPTRFDGLMIENCHLARTDRNGITTGGPWSRLNWYPSLHVVIRNNLLEDVGGDGIVPIACDGAVIEHNILRGGRMRAQDYAAGIWPWSCDNTIVEYNQVSGMKGTNDGEGFDSDWNCRNSLFQYNYSHDNDGGFMLICDDGSSKSPANAGNFGTVVRYNISVDDGLHTFNITGPCLHTRIYNNVFYIPGSGEVQAVASGNWGGTWPSDTRFSNNIFYTSARSSFDLGAMDLVTFTNNIFWGDFGQIPQASQNTVANPLLLDPGSKNPLDYRPEPGSPCFDSGAAIPDNGALDFAGNAVSARAAPTIGAFEAGRPPPAMTKWRARHRQSFRRPQNWGMGGRTQNWGMGASGFQLLDRGFAVPCRRSMLLPFHPSILQLLIGFGLAASVSAVSLRLGLLAPSGAAAATLVGSLVFGFGGWQAGCSLLVFFASSSALGQWRRQRKADLGFEKGGRRDAAQVLANGAVAALLAVMAALIPSARSAFAIAFLSALAEANADTWATEIGSASGVAPRSIITMRMAAPGASGAISLPGIAAAILGASAVGAMSWLLPVGHHPLAAFGIVVVCGFAGCLCDSLLGAGVQAQYYQDESAARSTGGVRLSERRSAGYRLARGVAFVDNDAVNFLSTLVSAVLSIVLQHLAILTAFSLKIAS